MSAEAVRMEMASAVRFLGGEGNAEDQIRAATRAARLPRSIIERLRWKKIKVVPAHVADTIRAAVDRSNEDNLRRANHERDIARQQASVLAARLMGIDPDLYGPEIAGLRRNAVRLGRDAHLQGGE